MDFNTTDNIEQDTDIPSSNEIQLHALQVLINGIKMAQKRGAYELPEAEILWNAIKVFMVKESNGSEANNKNNSINCGFQNGFLNN